MALGYIAIAHVGHMRQGHEQVACAIDATLLIAGDDLCHAQRLSPDLLYGMVALFSGGIEHQPQGWHEGQEDE
jgi:hypothetical protein